MLIFNKLKNIWSSFVRGMASVWNGIMNLFTNPSPRRPLLRAPLPHVQALADEYHRDHEAVLQELAYNIEHGHDGGVLRRRHAPHFDLQMQAIIDNAARLVRSAGQEEN
jgi:hypothetical protein